MNLQIIPILSFLLLQVLLVKSQTSDSIQIVRKPQVNFVQNSRLLKPPELLKIMKSNPEAYALMKKAKSGRDTGNIIGSVGGFLFGYTLGRALGGGNLNVATLVAGAGIVGLSIPFSASYAPNAVKAVNVYNDGLHLPSSDGAMLKLGAQENGVGIGMIF